MQVNQYTMKPNSKNFTNIFRDKNFYIINLVTLMGILGGTLFNPALPTMQQFFHISEDAASWTSTIYQLPSAIVTPIFGILADSLGRKQILLPSLLLFAVGGGLSGITSNFFNHLGWRLVQGVGAASLEPLQLTIIGDLYRGRTLGIAMAFNASLIGISGAIFPLIGGFLGEFNWQYTFLPALLAVPLAIYSLLTLRLPKHHHYEEKFELKSYLQGTWKSINNRPVMGLLFAVMSLFLLQTLCLTYIPFLATNKFQTSAAQNGIILASMSIALALVASQLEKFTQSLSEIKLIKLSFLLFAIALIILPVIPNFWLLFIPMSLLGAAQGLALPSSQALLAGLAAQESRGGFTAINMTLVSWGQTLGPFLGSLTLKYLGIQAVFYSSAILSVISFAIFNYFLTTKVFSFTAKTIYIAKPSMGRAAMSNTNIVSAISEAPASPTILQHPLAQLIHIQTDNIIELPEDFEVITLGKQNGKVPLDINLADLPNSGVISRLHAQIRFDGTDYYIQDMGSANGTFINKYPVLPGVWYKLKPGLCFSLGRRNLVSFRFDLV
ncbi:major facilitator transporter [Calothrix sp. NIES-4101]|nr:major facilitator transporter [Calothrix sp. NIES-4101]